MKRWHRVWAVERADGEEVARFDSWQAAFAQAEYLRSLNVGWYRVVSFTEAA